jgi:hypothetical protein
MSGALFDIDKAQQIRTVFMNKHPDDWLDVLTGGQILRDWLRLAAPFFLGSVYWMLVIGGLMVSISLMLVLVGFPMFLFVLAGIRALAALDHQMMAALLNEPAPTLANDVDARGANLGERLGMYLGSGQTWRSLMYLVLTLPLGAVTFSLGLLMLPLMFVELLILAPLRIDMHLVSARLLHFLAIMTHKGTGLLLPRRISKRRDFSRLETVYDNDGDGRYILDDDGEIYPVKAKRST